MTLNDYQKDAMRMASGVIGSCDERIILNGTRGLNGEVGEIIDILKKHLFQGHEIDRNRIALELGDVLWYVAVLAQGIGYELDEVAELNKNKRALRYPNDFEVKKSTEGKEGDI